MITVEDPVVMCHTYDMNFWCHGWVDKPKFKAQVLKSSPGYGDYDARDVFVGKVYHGWIITVAGDTSGCGWDSTMYFQKEEPIVVDGTTDLATVYEDKCKNHGDIFWEEHDWSTMSEDDCSEEEHDAEVIDGPHRVTWWEP